ncbi:alginate lyase family protein [Frigidibacter sp.]|uniref:alginate lyase family protein n=1 Tax=Frigidibacter sp. TaxID=2586418 RepID=UPI002735CAEF|nr:alginate lyase family protein [Frigidibacter sp.]MDP3342283.1 alginate lyase family protein [Frigidibacter sp.]
MALCLAQPLAAQEPTPPPPPPPEAYVCKPIPDPVVTLDHGSRYIAKDKSRSEFDSASNADVNAQLKPVDDFISTLASAANHAASSETDQLVAAECVLAGLAAWAEADALSELGTMNAQLSAPSRVAGLAFAFAQVQPLLPASDDKARVEHWLAARALATMDYFDTEAPKNASRNNLRAWAALAVARVGLTVGDQAMIDWADASVQVMVCSAAEDGSLPLEMARKDLALHYQLHAVAPLVVTAALLQPEGHDLFSACDGALHRLVDFVLAAFDDPSLVEGITGHEQSYFNGKEDLRGFEMAWADAYLSLFENPELAKFTEQFVPLGNSKLGGEQSLIWASADGQN